MAFNIVGNPACLDRQHPAIVTGKYDFCTDRMMANKLHAATVGSTISHGKITKIDASAALALPGVEAVCTYQDCPVFFETILFWGQEVAAVAATDPYIAEKATQLIKVEYETRPSVFDMEEAMKAGAPLVGVWPDRNVTNKTTVTRGDIAKGFAESDIIIEETIGPTAFYQHFRIEPESALAYWIEDHVYIYLHNRDPFGKRTETALRLNLPEHKVHLQGHGCGGSHGSVANTNPQVIAAVLAKKTGKPVQLLTSRRNDCLQSAHQFSCKAKVKLGAKADGTFWALDMYAYGDGGAAPGAFVQTQHNSFNNTFAFPHGKFVTDLVVTNKPLTGTWRNVLEPSAALFSTIIVEKLADKLNMNPLDLRLKNLYKGELKHPDTKIVLSCYGIKEVLEKIAELSGYRQKWHAPGTKTLPDGRLHGVGITGHMSTYCTMWDPVGAILNMTRDGKALINAGISRTGGGTVTAMCCIVAEMMGLKWEDVVVGDWGNTDTSSYGGMQAGSSRTITLGAAYYNAAKNAREEAFAWAANILKTTPDKLDAKDSKIFVKDDPTQSTTYAAVCTAGFGARGGTIIGKGYGWKSVLQRQQGDFPVGTPCTQLEACGTYYEIAVDPNTGVIEILDLVNVDDPGTVIFRKGGEGQMYGATMIQEGLSFYYEQIFDKTNGATLNPSFLHHRHPTTLDAHLDKHRIDIVETYDNSGPYGAHGMGEPPVQSFSAIMSAFYNATGKWITDPPLYPQKVLKALGKV